MASGPEEEVRAAGGVVIRDAKHGGREVAIVHRSKYDDWSLPKGKLAPGEGFRAAALREVAEESGLRCEALAELPPSRYLDHKGRRKEVRWWSMRPLGGTFEPTDEVDELRWVPVERAGELLDYEQDRELVAAAASAF
ncbi:MAG: NUDIX hydrolase [Solirubrobacterales bacterium]